MEAVKQKYPDKRLVVVFKPNTYSRTRDFKDKFVEVLSAADKVFLTEIDCNREKQEDYPDVKSENIVKLLNNGKLISDDTWDLLKEDEGSVILFMSPKQIHNIMESYKKYLEEK